MLGWRGASRYYDERYRDAYVLECQALKRVREKIGLTNLFDERNEWVKQMTKMAIATAKKCDRKIGICGQALSDYPEFAQFLVEQGSDSISLNPDSVLKTLLMVAEVEAKIY